MRGESLLTSGAKKVARFGLLTAMALVLGLLDRAIPISAILGGALPGIKLGLANTVLLYALYLMDWESSIILMIVKVFLSGFLYGSLTAILYSLDGGVVSMAAMVLLRNRPARGAAIVAAACAVAVGFMLYRTPHPAGQRLWIMILIGLACAGALAVCILSRKGKISAIMGTSLAGAVGHNVGQMLVAAAATHSSALLMVYLPVLVGVGAAVGCLTGIVTERVLKALRLLPNAKTHKEIIRLEEEQNNMGPGAGGDTGGVYGVRGGEDAGKTV